MIRFVEIVDEDGAVIRTVEFVDSRLEFIDKYNADPLSVGTARMPDGELPDFELPDGRHAHVSE